MKKLLLLIAVVTISITGYAQSGASNSTGMYLEGSVGYMKLKASADGENFSVDLDGIALDLGLGYRHAINPYLTWNTLKFNVMTTLSDLSETITPQLKTGLRGTSPEFSNMSLYGEANFGIGYQIEWEKFGFAYDLGIGLNVTPKIAVGFNFNSQRVSVYGATLKYNFYGAKIAYTF